MNERFPWFVSDGERGLMLALVPGELQAWRFSVAHHKALKTVNEKLRHRRFLEQSFDLLKMGWEGARRGGMAMAA